MSWAAHLIQRVSSSREPDQVIPGSGSTYLRRWFLVPKNRFFNVYLHQFLRSDDDRALHDHPWLFNASLLLLGEYVEHTIRAGGIAVRKPLKAGSLKVRFGPAPHRIELLTIADFVATQPRNDTPVSCWTLFVTGPLVRPWGFHCRHGWVASRVFGKKGCDQ